MARKMKRWKLRLISLLFFFLCVIFATVAGSVGEEEGSSALVYGIIAFICFSINLGLWDKAKWRCRCGYDGRAIDSEYLGEQRRWSDSSDGKTSTLRRTRKYRLILKCPSCGKEWTVKTSKEGPTDTISYS